MTDVENTYNEDNVQRLGMNWEEYEEMMGNWPDEREEREFERHEYEHIQRNICNWMPDDRYEEEDREDWED